MKSFLDYKTKPLEVKDVKQIENYLSTFLSKKNYYLKASNHFVDRVNDERNGSQISTQEIISLITKFANKYSIQLQGIPPGTEKEIVITDKTSKINIPSILRWSPKNKKYEFFLKSIMRKSNFQSSKNNTPQFVVEQFEV